MSTRFQISARESCSAGESCWDLNSAVRMVWSSSCGWSWDILKTVICRRQTNQDMREYTCSSALLLLFFSTHQVFSTHALEQLRVQLIRLLRRDLEGPLYRVQQMISHTFEWSLLLFTFVFRGISTIFMLAKISKAMRYLPNHTHKKKIVKLITCA